MYTKGPWRFVRLSWGCQVVSASGKTIVAAIDTDTKGLTKKAIDTRVGDAHLIAAAPELLEALIAFVDAVTSPDFEMTDSERAALELARAAIAKATQE